MNIDELPEQFEAFTERARVVLNREVEKTRGTIDTLNAEKAKAQATIAQLADQKKQAEVELTAVVNNLGRASSLTALSSEIAKAKADLEKLRGETEKLSTTLTALRKQQGDEERKLLELRNETSALTGLRSEHETAIGNIKKLLRSFG